MENYINEIIGAYENLYQIFSLLLPLAEGLKLKDHDKLRKGLLSLADDAGGSVHDQLVEASKKASDRKLEVMAETILYSALFKIYEGVLASAKEA